MDIRKLQRAIVDGLEDVKAQNIAVFNTEHLTPLFERVIIASGTSNRQTKALAASVRDAVKASGNDVLRTEGEAGGEWIIVDCGAAVAHIMQPGVRDYYRLEELWGDKPVRVKLDAAGPAPRSAAPGATAKKTAAKKAPAKKAPAKKTPAATKQTSAAKRTPASAKAPSGRTTRAAQAGSAARPPAAKKKPRA